MTEHNNLIEIIETLQNVQGNIKVFSAVPMGILMILYFFTYARLVDEGMYGLLIFEMVSSVLFIFAIIKMNQLSFGVIRFWYRNTPPYNDILLLVDHVVFAKKPEEISKHVEQQRVEERGQQPALP